VCEGYAECKVGWDFPRALQVVGFYKIDEGLRLATTKGELVNEQSDAIGVFFRAHSEQQLGPLQGCPPC
jgi:hypothetical protein